MLIIYICPTAVLSLLWVTRQKRTGHFLFLLNFGFQVAQEDWFICSFFISLCSKEPLCYLPGTCSGTDAYSDGPICFVYYVCSQEISWGSGDVGLSHSQGSLYAVMCYMAVLPGAENMHDACAYRSVHSRVQEGWIRYFIFWAKAEVCKCQNPKCWSKESCALWSHH